MPVACGHRELQEPAVLLVPVDDVSVMDREEPAEHVLPLLVGERAVDGDHRQSGVLVVGATGVILELVTQARHHREMRLHPRELLEQARHVEVVLRRVQAHPRQDELARLGMLVVRLVHVPDDRDGQLPVHTFTESRDASAKRLRTRSGSSARMSQAARGPLGFPKSAM